VELKTILSVHNLDFRYKSRTMFNSFSGDFTQGITWFRGANGAGKTTLLKLFAGALTPQRGSICLNGIDQNKQPLEFRRKSFFCSGDIPVLPWLSVRDFLHLHLSLYPEMEREKLNREIDNFRLNKFLLQPISTLSLGQNKKLQLAIALACPVLLLLMDEPFNALDVEAINYLNHNLSSTERLDSQCILMTSHLISDVNVTRIFDVETII